MSTAYVTLDDLRNRLDEEDLVRLTNRSGGEAVDMVVLGEKIRAAGELVEEKLAGRAPLPWAQPYSATLIELVGFFTIHGLMEDRGLLTEELREGYKNRIARMAAMQEGTAALPVASATSAGTPVDAGAGDAGGILFNTPDSAFGDLTQY